MVPSWEAVYLKNQVDYVNDVGWQSLATNTYERVGFVVYVCRLSSLYCAQCWYRFCVTTSFTKEVNSRITKRSLVFNGHLANSELTSLVEEASVGGQMTQSVFSKGVFCEFQGLTYVLRLSLLLYMLYLYTIVCVTTTSHCNKSLTSWGRIGCQRIAYTNVWFMTLLSTTWFYHVTDF